MVASVGSKHVFTPVVPAVLGQIVLDVLDELVAVAGDDKLSFPETVALEDGLSNATAVIMIDCVDSIVQNDQRAAYAEAFRKQNGESKATDMAFAQHRQCVQPPLRLTTKGDLNALLSR